MDVDTGGAAGAERGGGATSTVGGAVGGAIDGTEGVRATGVAAINTVKMGGRSASYLPRVSSNDYDRVLSLQFPRKKCLAIM